VAHVESGGVESPHVGDKLQLRASVELDGLDPDDITVEVVYGRSRADETIEGVRRAALEPAAGAAATDAAAGSQGPRLYTGTVVLDRAGAFGYTVRVVPRNPLLRSAAELGLVAVAG
jgi:glycogen phosphorylase